ncbi:MAG TPA: MFS transporter [Methanoculleus sp.]|nr:MFS transporter [Methanoculleus sp.]
MERKWLVLAAVMLGSVMGPIDASVVNVVLPTIAEVFGTGISTAQWVPMVYLLMISSLLLTYGRLGDMHGYRAVYLSGLAGFAASSAVCGLSGSIGMLIAARAVQGVTAGMMMAVGPAIIVDTFPASERGRALGINATSIAIGLAVGPTLGGFIAAYLGWRFIFFINIPIGVAALLIASRILPEGEPRPGQSLDLVGAGSAFVGLFSFLLLVNRWQAMGGPQRFGIAIVMLAALAVFIRTELTVPQPMLDLRIFSIRTFTFANLSAMLNFMSQYILVFLTPFYLQQVMGYTPDRIGMVMVAFPLAVLLVAPVSGALSDRIGTRAPAALGAGVCALALFLMARGEGLLGCLALFGLGTGLFQSPNNSAVMGSTPKKYLGVGSAVLATVRNVGMVLGIAVGGAVLAWRMPVYGGLTEAAFHDAYIVGAILTGIAAVTSLVRYRSEIAA